MPENRRVDIRRILADPELRRELMVATVQATQAREGIETSREQAERAYYVVTEGERTAFFDLEQFRAVHGNSERREEAFALALRDCHARGRVRLDVARRDFSAVDGSPLAYRLGPLAHVFREAVPLEPSWGIAAQGVATADDSRFVRCRWELPNEVVGPGRDWVPFAKGGEFSRFYTDVYLAVLWRDNGAEIRRYDRAYIRNEQFYFKAGLTWPRRTQKGFNLRVLPEGCIFADKGPAVFPINEADTFYLLGVANSAVAEHIMRELVSFGSWEVGVIKRLPVPRPTPAQRERIADLAQTIYEAKAAWDEGNETSTRFRKPWLLRDDLSATSPLSTALERLTAIESDGDARVQKLYGELNDEVYKLYGVPDSRRSIIEDILGERPPELLWPQMEGKTAEHKRMEHVFRLLSYVAKRVVADSEDGIAPFSPIDGQPDLVERVHLELAALFRDRDVGQVEAEIANELRKNVSGYRRTAGIGEWLRNIFFEFHGSLYRNTPVIWHLASSRGTAPFAFGALVDYHRFDRNRMAKLRSHYLREAIETFRREAALADKSSNAEARLEWQTRLEEAVDFDRRLQWVEEGHHEGRDGGPYDYRILTPWKSAKDRPKGWDPDLDDGVQVNIAPLYRAGLLRANG
jgi:hypothetical protein